MSEGSKRRPRWTKLLHNGVLFPAPYGFRGLCVPIRGSPFRLDASQEEMLWAFARKKGTPYRQDPVFIANFLEDFRKTLPEGLRDVKIEEMDLSPLEKLQEEERAAAAAMTQDAPKAAAAKRKEGREKLRQQYGWAEVDGARLDRAGYVVEPAGLFMGRGAHPLRGRWKRAAREEDITLNLGEDAPVPPGEWRAIVHDHASTWLASWKDELTGKTKHMWLSDLSPIRQENDRAKYDKAAILFRSIEKVRRAVSRALSSRDRKKRQLAVVSYLIDKLAMRVGDEKDKDEADTVGASTLRVEHVSLKEGRMLFDFLGKDSVRWQKEIAVSTDEDRLAEAYLRSATSSKKPSDLLFGGITSAHVNRFLSGCAPGLSAKVFRTFHATRTVEDFLSKAPVGEDAPEFEKVYWGRLANLEAAKTCNHKRTPSAGWEASLEKKKEKLAGLEKEGKGGKAAERVGKAERDIELAVAVRDYNLNTSLRNYIDPRVYARWSKRMGLDARRLYPSSLQKKFSWLKEIKPLEKKKRRKA